MGCRRMEQAERAAVLALLANAGLPIPGEDEPEVEFWVAGDPGTVSACAGLQRFGSHTLLRSVAVAQRARKAGLGTHIVRRVLPEAGRSVWLFTRDAQGFFSRLGFEETPRAAAPPEIAGSAEFRHACGENATFMQRTALS